NKIPFRVENGRYLLPDEAGIEVEAHRMPVAQIMPERDNAQTDLRLKMELQKAREEIAELKTLIAFYEERIPGPRLDV
ncbi:MAG: hypothetical protein NDJ90_10175, partial [Oligoflexia bacterium]|nr:hypothetical protein [Oligoflexia bacterium]